MDKNQSAAQQWAVSSAVRMAHAHHAEVMAATMRGVTVSGKLLPFSKERSAYIRAFQKLRAGAMQAARDIKAMLPRDGEG